MGGELASVNVWALNFCSRTSLPSVSVDVSSGDGEERAACHERTREEL